MTAPYECEVRFLIEDIESFHGRLAKMGARAMLDYAFTDYYYRPRGIPWDTRTRALRIREHHVPVQPCEILLTWIEMTQMDGITFKRSRFPEGKVRLYEGTIADCRAVLDGLALDAWLTVRKHGGTLFEIPGLGELVTELVDSVGWMCEVEVEGANAAQAARTIKERLRALEVPLDAVISDPIAAIVAGRTVHTGRKVYFCGSIRGGRSLQPLYASIVSFLQQKGYEVLTTYVAAPDVLVQEWREGITAADIYTRDLHWLADCDLVIAEVSTPSLGVGVEVASAQHLGKPVLCLCRADVALSAMIAGNETLKIIRYGDHGDLYRQLERELRLLVNSEW